MKLMKTIKSAFADAAPLACGDRDCTTLRRFFRRIFWRRGRIRLHERWYCSPQCFERAAANQIARALGASSPRRGVRHRIPLGLLMISRGQLTNHQLRAALELQRREGKERIGRYLERLRFVTEEQVTAALGLQWACPVLFHALAIDPCAAHMLPYRLLECYRMVPLRFVETTRVFHLGFCEELNYNVLYAIEQMLQCRTDACLVGRRFMDGALEQLGRNQELGDFLFESWRPAAEIARITSNYALKLGAEQARIVGCGEWIWARLQRGPDIANLLFRSTLCNENVGWQWSKAIISPADCAG